MSDKAPKRIYALFARTDDNRIVGCTEHSFSMGWSFLRVRPFDCVYDGPSNSYLSIFKNDKYPRTVKTDEGTNVVLTRPFIYRVSRRRGPIKVHIIDNENLDDNKYLKRNRRFTVRDPDSKRSEPFLPTDRTVVPITGQPPYTISFGVVSDVDSDPLGMEDLV